MIFLSWYDFLSKPLQFSMKKVWFKRKTRYEKSMIFTLNGKISIVASVQIFWAPFWVHLTTFWLWGSTKFKIFLGGARIDSERPIVCLCWSESPHAVCLTAWLWSWSRGHLLSTLTRVHHLACPHCQDIL